jgi:hypothetical protein
MVVNSKETQKTRDSIINKLKKQFNKTGLTFLLDADVIVKHVENTPTARGTLPAHGTIKTTISNIKSALRDGGLDDSVYDAYLKKYASEQTAKEEEQTKTPAQEKNWIDWERAVQVRNQMPEGTQKHLIASLYTMIPPARLDYTPMRWVSRKPKTTTENYIVPSSKGTHTFIINQYKTAEAHGQIVYKAGAELDKVLKAWREAHPEDTHLLMSSGQPMTPNALSQKIKDIFREYAGVPATLNILRHSYSSHIRKDELPLKEKQKIAKMMGHSTAQAELYRKL